MNTLQTRILSAGIFFLLIFLAGFRLARTGKPYSLFLFNAHKLIAVAALIYLVLSIIQLHRAAPLAAAQIAAASVMAVLFIAAIATGGLVSAMNPAPDFVKLLHKLLPYLTVLSTAVVLYLLAGR